MAQQLYKLIPDAFAILSTSQQKIGQLGVDVVDQENSPRQQQTINQLIAATMLYGTIMRHVVLNDDGTAIAGIQHIEVEVINDLLESLKKTVALPPIPVYPTPLTTVNFNFGTPGGLNLGAGQLGDLIVHDGTKWTRLSKGDDGYTLTSTSAGLQWQSQVGNGIPAGGAANQYLRKASNTNYDVVWGDIVLAHVTDVTASASEVNVLDGVNTGSIAATQINQLAGISTAQTIQQQLNAKMSNALASGQFWVGNSSNIAEARTPSGDVTFNNEGVFSYTPLSIEDADINTTAAIQRNKLAGGSSWRLVINNDSGVMDEAAAITANRALASNANGIPVATSVTATELGYSSGLTGNIQNQLNNKLTVSVAGVSAGDILTYNGSAWVNLGAGSSGQVLSTNGSSVFWGSPTANGLPAGGSASQVLRKVDATDYNTEWHTIVTADLSDLSVTASELNVLSGVNTGNLTSTHLNYLIGVTSSVQTQLDNKLTRSLAFNNIWVGGPSNEAVQMAPGNEGDALVVVGGSPQWQPIAGGGGGIVGPGASTDNAIARWNGSQGIAIQNSGVIIDDSDNVSGVNSMTLQAGAPIRTGSTNGDTVLLQAYDVDGLSYVTFATLTAGNIPGFDLSASTTIDSSYIYRDGGTDVSLSDGGTGTSLSDPGEYMLMFWNQSIGQVDWLAIGTNLSLSGSSPVFALNASGGGGGSGHVIENSGTPLDTRDNLNFTGGLTAFDSNPDTVVRLGGTLTANVVIDGDSSFDFTVTGSPDITLTADTSLQVGLSTNHIAIDSTGIHLAFGSGSEGDLFYEDSSGYLSRVAIGTEGQILTVDAAGVPVWDDAPAGGTYTDSDAQNAVGNIFTDSSTIDFTYNSGAPSITGIVINNSITNMKLRQSAGVSVVGRSVNSTGNVADITAAANGQVLMRSSDALSFGLITGANFTSATANTFFAGPTSGTAASATFRAIVPVDLPFPIKSEDDSTYLVEAADHGYTIYFTNPSGCTVTLPTGLADDFWFTAVRAKGAGTVTFVASGSADINTVNNEVTIDFANGAVSWEYLGDSNGFDWYGFGALGSATGGGGSGTVTSVNNSSIPGLATATGGPITGSGILGYTLDTQSANTVFAGPTSGSAEAPSFRLLTMADIPRPAKDVPEATYTVIDDDLGHNLYFTNTDGCIVTLDDEILSSNFWFLAIKDKAMTNGTVQFVAGGDAIINTVGGEDSIVADNGAVSWEYKGSGDWYGWGTLGGGSSGGGGGHAIKNSGITLADRPNINFRNGITAVDLNPDIAVGLGGSLVADTTINADSHDFKITAIDEFLIQRSGNNRIEMNASGAIHLHTGGDTASSITLHPTNGIIVTSKGAGFGSGSMVVVDSTNSLINFGPSTSSLIGKSAAGSFASVIVSNGITHDATVNTLKLGGALTATTTISGAFGITFSNSYWTFGSRTAGTSTNSMSVGSDHVMNNQNTFAAGFGHTINNGSGAAFGTLNVVSGDHGFSVGWTNTSSGTASFTAGTGNIASHGSSMATGASTRASGLNSWSGGRGFTSGSRFLFASGTTSFNFSENTVDQVAGHGASANNSAILGGINHNIESGNVRAAIIGGSGIKLTGTTYIDTVAVPHLAIFSTPGDGGSDDVLTWNSTTKKIGKVSQASLGGGGGGSGTVTSVAATAPAAGFTISGSPITTSGTLTFALANDLAGLENLSGTGLAVRTGTSTWTNRTIVGGTGISVTNGNGVSANPSIALSHLGIQNLSNPGADRIMFWDQSGSKAEWLTVDTNTLTISGTTLSANYGSGTAGQVAYWSGSNTLTSEAGFEYDEGTNTLKVHEIDLDGTDSIRSINATGGTNTSIHLQVRQSGSIFLTKESNSEDALEYYPHTNTLRSTRVGNDAALTFTIRASDAGSSFPSPNGDNLLIKAGSAYSVSGDGNGGDITIQSGQRRTAGAGVDGDIVLDPLTGFVDILVTPSADVVSASTHTAVIKFGGVSYKVLLATP